MAIADETVEMSELDSLSTCRYVHITGIEYFVDATGRRYLDPLWHKDLMQHLVYMPRTTLVASHDPKLAPPAGSVLVEGELTDQLRFVPLPFKMNWPAALLWSPVTATRIWHEVRDADLVFAGFIEWPIPLGWIATPIIRLQHKKYYTFFDSAFWRLPDGIAKPIHRRIRNWFTERLNRACLRSVDLAFITQEGYREAFGKHPDRAHLIHASWIDAADLLTVPQAEAAWADKAEDPDGRLKLLFVGRLDEGKGVKVLLDAIARLDSSKASLRLDILGKGDLESMCVEAAAAYRSDIEVRFLGTVPYAELFSVIRSYHAVLVPSITDEQPRIVYDAFSQAVPVIASDTDGLRDCVHPDKNGVLVTPNDPRSLAQAIEHASKDVGELERLGMNALEVARGLTHSDMHAQRRHLLSALVTQQSSAAR